jgi:hypothetical protein
MALTVDQLTRGLEKARAAGDSKAVREIEAELSRVQSVASPAQAPAALSPERLALGLERARAAGDTAAVREIEAELGRIQGAARQVPQPAPQMEPDQPVEIEANPMGANLLSILRSPQGQEFIGAATRQIPPLLTAMRMGTSATPLGLAANIGATGLTAALAELSARSFEGQDVTSRESLGKAGKSAIEFGAPGPILGGRMAVAAGQDVFRMGGRAVFGPEGGFRKAVQAGLLTASSIGVGRETEARIARGEAAPEMTREQMFKEVVVPSLVSSAFTASAQTLGRAGDIASEIASRREFLQSVGVRNPTLGALMPERFGQIELAMATAGGRGSSAIRTQRDQMRSEASQAVADRFFLNRYASNEDVARYINPKIDEMAQADDMFARANVAYEQAQASYKSAQEAATLNPLEMAQVVQDAQERVYAAMQVKAKALLDASVDTPMVLSNKAKEVSVMMGDLFKLRSNVAKDKYVPLRAIGAVFSIDEIEAAAKRGMGAYADTEQGKQLLSGIRNYRGDGVVTTPSRANPEAQFDPTAPRILPEEVRYDLEAVRQMREGLSDIIDGVKDAGVVARMEKEAGNAYNAINESIRGRLKETGGEQLVKQWDDARGYWATSFRAMETDQKALRLLMRGKASADDIEVLAKDLISGKAGTIEAVSLFVDAISESDPVQKNLALSVIGSAVSNDLLVRNGGGDAIQWNKVLDDVVRMSGLKGMQEIFPVEKLGLGSRQQILQNRAVVREFSRRGLTDEAIGEAFASPLFAQAIAAGTPTSRPLTQAMAVAEYKQRVLTSQGLLAADLKYKANQELKKADEALRRSGMSREQAVAKIQELQLDPAFQVLTGQKKLSNAPEVTASRIGDIIMRSDTATARTWLSYLEKSDPGAYDQITTNTLANFLQKHLRASGDVDFQSLARQFSDQNTELRKLYAVIPESTMKKLSAMPDVVKTMDDTLSARPVSDSSLRRAAQIFGLTVGTGRTIRTGTAPSQSFNSQGYVKTLGELIANGSYHIVAHQLMKPDSNLISLGSSFAETISRMPTQQALILSNNALLTAEMAREDARRRSNNPPR